MTHNKLLTAANIPKAWCEQCYISKEGVIFTPSFDEDGTMLCDGKANYDYYIAHKNDSPPEPEAGENTAALKKEIDELRRQLDELERGIANG